MATDPAALLAAGQPEPALAVLDTSRRWRPIRGTGGSSQALRARAERLRGRPEQASAALAPLVAARRTPPGLPRELIADEYARSLMAQAARLPQREADALRRQRREGVAQGQQAS